MKTDKNGFPVSSTKQVNADGSPVIQKIPTEAVSGETLLADIKNATPTIKGQTK